MPKYIKPIVVPKPVLQPSRMQNANPRFRLDEQELFLFDVWAQEPTEGSGTECELFTLNLAKSKVDALYSEPTERAYDGPYLIMSHVEWPEGTPSADEEGFTTVWPSGCWIPRILIEQVGARPPQEGDILRFWKLPYFDKSSVNELPNNPNAGYFFEVIKVNDDGHLFDSSAFVAFRCDLKRRSKFAAERLLPKK